MIPGRFELISEDSIFKERNDFVRKKTLLKIKRVKDSYLIVGLDVSYDSEKVERVIKDVRNIQGINLSKVLFVRHFPLSVLVPNFLWNPYDLHSQDWCSYESIKMNFAKTLKNDQSLFQGLNYFSTHQIFDRYNDEIFNSGYSTSYHSFYSDNNNLSGFGTKLLAHEIKSKFSL